jgi:hypothetical protein
MSVACADSKSDHTHNKLCVESIERHKHYPQVIMQYGKLL